MFLFVGIFASADSYESADPVSCTTSNPQQRFRRGRGYKLRWRCVHTSRGEISKFEPGTRGPLARGSQFGHPADDPWSRVTSSWRSHPKRYLRPSRRHRIFPRAPQLYPTRLIQWTNEARAGNGADFMGVSAPFSSTWRRNREEFRVRTPDGELSVEDLTVPAVGIDNHPLLTPRLSRQPSVTLWNCLSTFSTLLIYLF